MDEYISREAVFDEIRFQRELAESDGEASVVDTCDAMLHNLREIEAADVQPVKHGRWEHGECSVCGASPLDHVSGDMYVEVDYYPNYCPSCGSQNVDLWVDDESVPNEDMRPDNEVM